MRFVLLLMLLLPATGGADVQMASAQQDTTTFFIDADSLQGPFGYAELPAAWSFHPGDDPAFADPDYDARAGWRAGAQLLLAGLAPPTGPTR